VTWQMERAKQNDGQTKVFVGHVISVLALMMGVPVAFFPALGSTLFLEAVASLGTIAITLGIIGYYLGSRLGGWAVYLTMGAILFGIAMSQGMVPGIEPTDTALPGDLS
jgi:putative Mn2+ efflux pump MntP